MPDIFRRRRAQSPSEQLEFRWEAAARRPLPGESELQSHALRLVLGLSRGERLTDLRVEWNTRLRTAVGRADYGRKLISLNPVLGQFGDKEIERTLRHELAHLLAQARAGRRRLLPHGVEWKVACHDLGLAGEPACHRLPLPIRRQRRRFSYVCASCHAQFPRVHRLRGKKACLACCRRFAHGDYDEQFRLQLVPRGRVT